MEIADDRLEAVEAAGAESNLHSISRLKDVENQLAEAQVSCNLAPRLRPDLAWDLVASVSSSVARSPTCAQACPTVAVSPGRCVTPFFFGGEIFPRPLDPESFPSQPQPPNPPALPPWAAAPAPETVHCRNSSEERICQPKSPSTHMKSCEIA